MDPKILKKTQDTLGKIIKKPPLTDKLLSKPPFRFLHDVMTSVIKTTGFMQGLYTDQELVSDNVKDKDSKVAFLQKAIDIVGLVVGKSLSAKPVKIVAGHEPEKTNEFLQALAMAINKNVDNDEFVKKTLTGDSGGGSSSKEKEKERDRTKSADRTKTRDAEEKNAQEKKDPERERTRDKGEREKKHDRDRERHKDRDKDRDRERESKTREKSRDGRDERHRDRSKKELAVTGQVPVSKGKSVTRGQTPIRSRLSAPSSPVQDRGQPSSHSTKSLAKIPSKALQDQATGAGRTLARKKTTPPRKSDSPLGKFSHKKMEDNASLSRAGLEGVCASAGHEDKQRQLGSPGNIGDSWDSPGFVEGGHPTMEELEGGYQGIHLNALQRSPGGDMESPKLPCRISNPLGRHSGMYAKQKGDGILSEEIWGLPQRDHSREKENESPEKVNGEKGEKQDPPARLQRPASAKGSRRRREAPNHAALGEENGEEGEGEEEEDEEFQKPIAPSHDAVMGEDDLPPQVAAARQLARPSSARPAPPRPKQEMNESEPAMRLGTGQPTNLIVDDDDDDDENFLVEESAPPPTEPDTTPLKTGDEEDAEHGSLVKKMLESKKELEGGSQNQTGPVKKTEIERPILSDAQRRKQREIVQKEVEKLRASIQSLTRSANPLGKVMDYVQEDLDSMQQELEKWSTENAQHALDLKREMGVTDRAVEPLRQQLSELERAISDQLDQIAACKNNIIKNDQKINKMLRGISSS